HVAADHRVCARRDGQPAEAPLRSADRRGHQACRLAGPRLRLRRLQQGRLPMEMVAALLRTDDGGGRPVSTQEDVEVIHEIREPAEFQSEDAGKTEGLERIHVGAPEHFEVVEFLEDESSALDDNQLLEWFDKMAPDILYRM